MPNLVRERPTVARRIRFRTSSNNSERLEELNAWWTENKEKPSLTQFIKMELTRGYLMEHDEERYSARREKVYSFMRIPRELERFLVYGFFQCADSFLFVFTFLPIRVLMTIWQLLTRPFMEYFGWEKRRRKTLLKPDEVCDLLKALILCTCSFAMLYVDTSVMYHMIKSQSAIKLYIFFNMLEVGDKLFSSLGQDTIDALFWTAIEPRDRKREHVGVVLHTLLSVGYVLLHSLLVLFQATTLNVAFNSNHKSLLTIMISNQFVELKGSVFKKFDKNNLFQVSCSDVRERFHLFILLLIVVMQTMKEYSWKEDQFWILLPDCFVVLLSEVFIDWIKHAFICRFNELPIDVYKDYTISLAYDVAQTRQRNAFTDHSDWVARRMGFIPLPLGVVMFRVLVQTLTIDSIPAIVLLLLALLALTSFRILNSLVILGKACDLIAQHKHEKEKSSAGSRSDSPVPLVPKSNSLNNRDVGTSPILSEPKKKPTIEIDSNLGPAALFSNSAVTIDSVCLNDELLKDQQVPGEDCLTAGVSLTRSTSDLADAEHKEVDEIMRAESEPNLLSIIDETDTSVISNIDSCHTHSIEKS